jgi:hypothetical protein
LWKCVCFAFFFSAGFLPFTCHTCASLHPCSHSLWWDFLLFS